MKEVANIVWDNLGIGSLQNANNMIQLSRQTLFNFSPSKFLKFEGGKSTWKKRKAKQLKHKDISTDPERQT